MEDVIIVRAHIDLTTIAKSSDELSILKTLRMESAQANQGIFAVEVHAQANKPIQFTISPDVPWIVYTDVEYPRSGYLPGRLNVVTTFRTQMLALGQINAPEPGIYENGKARVSRTGSIPIATSANKDQLPSWLLTINAETMKETRQLYEEIRLGNATITSNHDSGGNYHSKEEWLGEFM